MNIEEAISDLARITAVLNRNKAAVNTEDASVTDELALILRDEQLAKDFADSANAVRLRMLGRGDCRPGLRSDADRRAHRKAEDAKTEVTAADDADSYARSMERELRK